MAATLVVAHHAARLTHAFPFTAGRLGVEFFFVLSGVVILTAHWDDIGHRGSLGLFAWKRFRRIYPIYWIVLFPQLVWIITYPRHINLFQRDPWVIVSSVILVHLNSVRTTVTVAWTLFHEVLFYAFFALLLVSRRMGTIAMGMWLSASVFFFFYQPTKYWGTFFSPLHLIFGMGMLAAWILRSWKIPLPLVLTVVGLFLFSYASYIVNVLPHSGDNISVLAGLGAMLALLGVVELERRRQLRVYSSLTLLGDASYAIYLVHYPILFVLAPATGRLCAQLHLPILAGAVALIVLATVLGLLFHLFLERPLLRWMGGLRQPALRTAAAS